MNTTDSPPASSQSPTVLSKARVHRAGLAAGAIMAAGFIIWPGCATPPLPSSRTPVGNLQKADVKMATRALTKSGVVSRLGKPDAYFEDLRVACYQLNHVSRRRLHLFLGFVPIGAPRDNLGLEVAMFQFDAQGNLLRQERKTVRGAYSSFMNFPGPQVKQGQAVPPDYFDSMLRSEAAEWVQGGKRKS